MFLKHSSHVSPGHGMAIITQKINTQVNTHTKRLIIDYTLLINDWQLINFSNTCVHYSRLLILYKNTILVFCTLSMKDTVLSCSKSLVNLLTDYIGKVSLNLLK